MKILFQNYATENSTEATYLAQCLSMVDGVDCDLWSNPNVSTYDVLDSYKPDLVATHYRFVTTDLIKYISSNPSSSPELILNVTGATPEEAESIEGLEGSGVKIRLAFTNSTVKEKFKKISFGNLLIPINILQIVKKNGTKSTITIPLQSKKISFGMLGARVSKHVEGRDYMYISARLIIW